MNKKIAQYAKPIAWILFMLFAGSLIGNSTQNSVDSWYQTLNRSPLTPPNYVFGVVWSILYVMIAITGYLIWEKSSSFDLRCIKKLYIAQLIFNWSWSFLFFRYYLIGCSLLCLTIIIVLVATVVIKAYQKLKIISLLFVPYLLWLMFAGYLNFYIWLYN